MAGKDNWARARAVKEEKRLQRLELSKKDKKKAYNKVKKSPILIVIVVSLILGLIGGFFAFTYLSAFDMNDFYINGIKCGEKDYVIVDMQEIKENYLLENPTADMEEIYLSVDLEDHNCICKFFTIDISDTVSTTYYYREDISHDTKQVDGIDVELSGVYYIEYKSSHFAFKNKTLIRTVIVTGVENDG